MSWLSKLRSEPTSKKIQLIWTITIVFAVLLIGVWVWIGNYRPSNKANTSLFQTIGKGIKNFSSQDFKKQGIDAAQQTQ